MGGREEEGRALGLVTIEIRNLPVSPTQAYGIPSQAIIPPSPVKGDRPPSSPPTPSLLPSSFSASLSASSSPFLYCLISNHSSFISSSPANPSSGRRRVTAEVKAVHFVSLRVSGNSRRLRRRTAEFGDGGDRAVVGASILSLILLYLPFISPFLTPFVPF